MSSLMVVPVSASGELCSAKLTCVGPLSRVASHVYLEVALLEEFKAAK